jgi:TetR/AcrR family transcriptional regulator, lmrAB and yxaGH operons repressor
MTKRSAKTQKTRTRLLDTASKLFRSQGFHATGLDQILRRSRTPKGSLYHYFPGGKDQLAIETVQYVAGEQGQMMSAIFSAQSDPLETL